MEQQSVEPDAKKRRRKAELARKINEVLSPCQREPLLEVFEEEDLAKLREKILWKILTALGQKLGIQYSLEEYMKERLGA